MVPRRLLKDDQKDRMQVCQDIIDRLQTEPDLLRKVISSDETRIFEYDPETERQSCQRKSPMSLRPKKANTRTVKIKSQSHVDHILRCQRHIVYSEFLPQGQTINQQVYKEILRLLLRSVHELSLIHI